MPRRSPDVNYTVLEMPSLVNWLGVVAGIMMIVLPFLGPWWIGRAGTGALEVALSPFYISLSVFGQPISSSLVELFLFAAKIGIIIAGIFMILASTLPKRWWSKRLMKYGATKPLWAIVGLLALLVLGSFFVNNFLPGILANMIPQSGAPGGMMIQINLPYVIGTSSSTISMGQAVSITAPVTFSITYAFWIAVITAALGIVARVYHRRYSKKSI